MMYVCMCRYVGRCLDMGMYCTPDWNDLKLGTVVVLDTVPQPTDFGFRRFRVRVRESCQFASLESAHSSFYLFGFLLFFMECNIQLLLMAEFSEFPIYVT